MNNKFLFLIFFISFLTTSKSQIATSKSLEDIIDTLELSKLLKQARKHQFSNPDSFIYFLDVLQDNSARLKSKKHTMLSHFFKGSYHLGRGEYETCLKQLKKSLRLSKELGNKEYENYSYLAMSSAYMFLAYYPLSQEYMMKALTNFEKENNYQGAAGVYLNMTFINFEQKDFQKAKVNSQLAYDYYKKSDNNLGIARALINLGEINYKLGNLDSGLRYSRKALYYTKISNQPSMDGIIYQNIANIKLEQNQLDSAHYYYQLSIDAVKDWGNSFAIAESKQGIAKAFAKQNKLGTAISNAKASYFIADTTQMAQVKADAASLLCDLYTQQANYKTALEYKNISAHINDSLFNKEKYQVQNEMEAIYQSQKKEQQIKTLSKEKEIEVLKNQQSKYYIITLVAVLGILIIATVLFFRINRLKNQQATIELEQRLLRSQMNPHFIFNALSSIQEFIMAKDPLQASSYLSNFAKLMRSILNNSATEFISIDEEIETLENYLKLQKLRFGDKLEYEIIVEDDMETDGFAIPPMLAQPFIENAIKHGIAKKSDGTGKVTVEFSENDNYLLLSITDNGVGLKQNANDSGYQSMATKITQSRINNFKKAYKKAVSFEVSNLFDSREAICGVKASFKLPKKELS